MSTLVARVTRTSVRMATSDRPITHLPHGLVAALGDPEDTAVGMRAFGACSSPARLGERLREALGDRPLTQYLLVLPRGVWHLTSTGGVHELGDTAAIGTGAAYALGALEARAGLEHAVQIACLLDPSSEAPVVSAWWRGE